MSRRNQVFHNDEGRERARGWRTRPDGFEAPAGRRAGRHHHDDTEEFGPGAGGPRGFGRGHGRGGFPGPGGPGGRGRLGWMARDFFGPERGPAVRRGDVRAAILVLLADEPMHGYQIIGKLGELSGGRWRPSAGSVYPTLQQLEDEGLVKGEERDGRNVFSLTDEGRTAAEEAAKNPAPWDVAGPDPASNLMAQFLPLAHAVQEVNRVGSPEMVEKARAILTETRRSLYRLLAEDDAAATTADPTQPTE